MPPNCLGKRTHLCAPIKPENCRTPQIMADAAHHVLCRDAKTTTGNFFVDDEVLAQAGVTDLEAYRAAPGGTLLADFFLE